MADPKKTNLDPVIEPDVPSAGGRRSDAARNRRAVGDQPDDSADAASGRDVIARFAKLAPSSPGVYRMISANGDVLYVGKAKNIKKRILAYARPTGHVTPHRAHDRGDVDDRVRLDRRPRPRRCCLKPI